MILSPLRRTLLDFKTPLEAQVKQLSSDVHVTLLTRRIDSKSGDVLEYDL